jgi:hypothetical protein
MREEGSISSWTSIIQHLFIEEQYDLIHNSGGFDPHHIYSLSFDHHTAPGGYFVTPLEFV